MITGIALFFSLALHQSLPVFAEFYNERGFSCQENGDLPLARKSYERALRLRKIYPQAHYNLATTYEDFDSERAIQEYRLAIEQDNQIYPAYNNLARLYLKRAKENDYELALGSLIQSRDLSPQDESTESRNVQYSIHKNLGWTDYALGNYLQAEKDLERAISIQPERAAAHCLLSYVLKQLRKPGVEDECYDCVSLSKGEGDVEPKWLRDANESLMKGRLK